MFVWLDDIRDPKKYARVSPNDWIWVRTYEETIELLKTGKVTRISLDHDLGTQKTGYDVICWIEEKLHYDQFDFSSIEIEVHSANTTGRKNILAALDSMEKYWLSTQNNKPSA